MEALPSIRQMGVAKYIANLPLKNKILFSSLAVIMLVSVSIALVARYILISSLTNELEMRGLAIAHSIADRSSGLMLTQDRPHLVSLVFEATGVGERKELVSYIFILDSDKNIQAHTFIQPFPDELRMANIIPPGKEHRVKLLRALDEPVYDIAVPIKEGIYDIGSVHVGLSKRHVDTIVGKLRIAFLGFITFIIIIMFFISELLSRYITRPIAQLIRISDEISRDNLDFVVDFANRKGCWEHNECDKTDCPAYNRSEAPCWYVNNTKCDVCEDNTFPKKLGHCKNCEVFKKEAGDEVLQLADSFKNMVQHLKEYREQLRKSQQKYRSLFHSGPDPIFVLDCENHEILDANPMAAEVYAYSRKELVGMRFDELAKESADACLSAFSVSDTDSMAGCVFFPKVIHYMRNGEPFYVNVHACATSYQERPAIILSTNNITDMIEKDAQLIQASKMKTLGEMSAGMAHELNQPLNAIKLGSEYLTLMADRGSATPPEQMRKVVKEISTQVDRAAEIINALREFGRKADLTMEKMDISKPVKGVLQILGQQMNLQNIELNLGFAEDLPRIMAHNNRLEQVLFNLVTNARDAINMRDEENGSGERAISITTFAEKGRVGVSIRDSGVGIPESKLDKIFEPFYTTKETGKGMGLGLAISYGIIKDYHGDIKVHSLLGKGTTFTLTFPAVD